MTQNNTGKQPIMKRIARIIVDFRYVIFVLFAAFSVFCVISIPKVKVNSDLTSYLPENTVTRQGIIIMNEEFSEIAALNVMVTNITPEIAESLYEQIQEIPNAGTVVYDETEAHFKDSSALFTISFSGKTPEENLQASKEVRALVEPYDHYIYSTILSEFLDRLASEMIVIMILAVIVIVGVLLFTSRSYFEVVIFAIVFIIAALLNMGTNYWMGQVSSITHTIAVIMQLALAIDYAIIFAHRYQDEAAVWPTDREAVIAALSKSIPEIASSSLTTISGLVALTLMQFRLGYDMGMVLAKGIICSMVTVFLLMPGLIMLFPKILKRTQHRRLIPNIEGWGWFLVKRKYLFTILFAVVLIPAIILSGKVNYAFADGSIDPVIPSENYIANHKIRETFPPSTPVIVLIPSGDYTKEKSMAQEIEGLDEIRSVTALSAVKVDDQHVLTDPYTPRMFAELVGIDTEMAKLLYSAYGLQHEQYQPLLGNASSYAVPLVDMMQYLFEKIDQGAVTLNEQQEEQLNDLRGKLEQGVDLLQGKNWSRMVLTSSVPEEGEESTAMVDSITKIGEKYYGEDSVLVIGTITSARDLRSSYSSDSVLINILTILFVFLIILFTFRSFFAAVILVFTIQGCIWINFALAYLSGMSCSFVTNMIVSAIQMGATIDYAIVLMSRYQANRQTQPKEAAMAKAVNESFPTVLTSGAIMTVAGFLIAYRVSDNYVGHIGLGVGRGALISMIVVLTVLPQLIVLLDKLIQKTRFHLNLRKEGAPKT